MVGSRYHRPVSSDPAHKRVPFELVLRGDDELFELTRFGHFLLLAEDGVYLGRSRTAPQATFIDLRSITHVVPHERSLWLATARGTRLIVRGRRRRGVSFHEIARGIERRIARLPGGIQQLSRMRELDARMQAGVAPVATWTVVGLCVAFHLLQLSDAFVSDVGAFVRELVGQGEYWRIVTGHFLHDATWNTASADAPGLVPWVLRLPSHITLNAALALLLGSIVEPSLGRWRTIWVLGMSALGATLLSVLLQAPPMIGASGMVLGLAGAVLALEVTVPERLPAAWRVPRRTLVAALVLQALGDWFLPYVAWAAHLGGFVAGYLAARVVARAAVRNEPPRRWLRRAVVALSLFMLLGFAGLAPLVLRTAWAFDRHAQHMLALEHIAAFDLNNLAWRIATETELLTTAPASALALAQRAVEETGRSNPDYLDTLAEVQFGAGDPAAAVETIDEAIDLAPWDDYFRAQRDRFIGSRAAADRPASPDLPWFLRGPSELPAWADEQGLEI